MNKYFMVLAESNSPLYGVLVKFEDGKFDKEVPGLLVEIEKEEYDVLATNWSWEKIQDVLDKIHTRIVAIVTQ